MSLKLDQNNPLDTKVQTRDGRKVRIICTDKVGEFPIVALVTCPEGGEIVTAIYPDGRYYGSDGNCPYDLINVPVEHERTYWLVHWKNGVTGAYMGYPASKVKSPDAVAITGPHTVRFKEGEGLEVS